MDEQRGAAAVANDAEDFSPNATAVPIEATEAVEAEQAADDTSARSESLVLTARLFRRDQPPRPVELAEVPERIADDANFVWIDVCGYTADDLRTIADTVHLHPTAVHMALSSWKRPSLDVFEDQFFATATVPELDPAAYRVQARELDLFVRANLVVSVHKAPFAFEERVATRAEQSSELLDDDSAFMVYILLDELLAHYDTLYEQIQTEIEQMEERALTDTSDAYLNDLLDFKRYVFALSQLTEQHREIFSAFLRPDFKWVSGEGVEVYFRDLEARLARVADALLGAKEATNGSFSIYVSHMSHRTNNIMKTLTIISAVLLPTSVIVGFFGVNNLADLPVFTHPAGFVLMIALIILVSVSILLTFRRKRWI